MIECKFLSPEEVKPLYGEIADAYQVAFASPPWDEVTKCADPALSCTGGLSPLEIGKECSTCGNCPTSPAYEPEELIERFEAVAATRPAFWYTEQTDQGLAMAALAWLATPSQIAAEKYDDNPEMRNWLFDQFTSPISCLLSEIGIKRPEPQIMWLDEVFANRRIKPNGNLQIFGKSVLGLAERLDAELVGYRTIEPRMTYVAERDFGPKATVFERNTDVPDRRDFVRIKL